jgi:hypothetical protein
MREQSRDASSMQHAAGSGQCALLRARQNGKCSTTKTPHQRSHWLENVSNKPSSCTHSVIGVGASSLAPLSTDT